MARLDAALSDDESQDPPPSPGAVPCVVCDKPIPPKRVAAALSAKVEPRYCCDRHARRARRARGRANVKAAKTN